MSKPPCVYYISIEHKEFDKEVVITIPAMALGYLAGDLENLIREMNAYQGCGFTRFFNVQWLTRLFDMIRLVMRAERPHNIWKSTIVEPRKPNVEG